MICPKCGSHIRNFNRSARDRKNSRRMHQEILSDQQLSTIINVAKSDPNLIDLLDLVVLVSGTGLRHKELAELRWTDVDLDKSRLVVKHAGRSRTIPLAPELCGVLSRRRDRISGEFVLGSKPETLLNRVIRQLRDVCEREGIGRVGFHRLRRTFIVRLLAFGADLADAMQVAGFSVPAAACFLRRIPAVPRNIDSITRILATSEWTTKG